MSTEPDDDDDYLQPNSKTLFAIAMNPFEFGELPQQGRVFRFVALSSLLSIAFLVPGIALWFVLSLLEAETWRGVEPGTRYLSLQNLFALPALFGMLVGFSGLYRGLLVGWPWLNSGSIIAYLMRFVVAIVMICALAVGGIALLMLIFAKD